MGPTQAFPLPSTSVSSVGVKATPTAKAANVVLLNLFQLHSFWLFFLLDMAGLQIEFSFMFQINSTVNN
jgi:hypothetical protein